ncbi:MAG TPA: hypothetical protein P5525_00810, partial [Candidatus Paceibacterota bacterium]|nr:hypothetical protein [Candidatus Paceibacterota bacterium]
MRASITQSVVSPWHRVGGSARLGLADRVASRGAMAGLETNAGSGDPAYSAADSDVVGRVASRGAKAGLETNAGSGDPAYSAAD